ncbi:MAG TPA: sigma-70 family RNA polymerase sigma factor [Bacillota bacterium]|nr:sigma-70 family RNA polymerase sigma factor [Bacillota bacterium]
MRGELEEICISFYDDVYHYIFSLARNEELAKDVTQDTFLKALKSLHQIREASKIKGWLFSIARNTFFTAARRNTRLVTDQLLEELVDVNMLTPEQYYLLQEKEAWWDSLVNSLSEEEKLIWELRMNEKFSFEEIAVRLGCKAGTVRVRFHRLRIKLITLLEEGVKKHEGL